METVSSSLKIRETKDTIQKWAYRTHITETTRQKILNSNVLLLPDEGYVEDDLLHFPAGTSDLFNYLNKHKSNELEIEACIEDEDYKELSLHADILMVAGLIATHLAAPIVVNLVSEILEPQKSLQMRQDLRQEKNLGSPFGRRKESRFN